MQYALNNSLWKTDNIISQISGNIKGILVKEINSSPKIKITLSEIEGNKVEDLTFTPRNINISKKKQLIKINLITRENKQSPINLETAFNCLFKFKKYVIENNQKIISIALIGDITNRIKINQMITYFSKTRQFKYFYSNHYLNKLLIHN